MIRRILTAYQNGLTSITMDITADDDRNQADVIALSPGTVIQLDSETLRDSYKGPISSLRWEWRRTRATVRVNVEVQPPVPEISGARLWLTLTGANVGPFPNVISYLYFVDAETGISMQVDVGVASFTEGLAYDLNHDVLYGTRLELPGALGRINVMTGVGTEIGEFSGADVDIRALAYDTTKDRLCGLGRGTFLINGVPQERTALYEIDTTDASLTQISEPLNLGSLGFTLAYSPAGKFLTTQPSATEARIVSLNAEDGTLEIIGDWHTELRAVGGMAFDPESQVLYGVSTELYRIDILGIPTRIGTADDLGIALGLGVSIAGRGLAFMRLPETQLTMPAGLSLTEAGGDITAAWDAVTDATGYVLEWREEGSGAAWQTVAVSAPPHTFTP